MNKVLITGGTGLVGSRLTELLLGKGFLVNILAREKKAPVNEKLKYYTWDVEKNKIEAEAFDGVISIIHLAGASVAGKRWTAERKKEIIDSRVKSTGLIYDWLSKNKHGVKAFISASGIDYYGDGGDKILKETDAAGTGFLSEVCQQWEAAASRFTDISLREVRLRTGIVLSLKGGALPGLTATVPFGFAEYFAKPPLYYPWIHIDDLCYMYIYAIENNNVTGPYNATAPTPLPMKDLMKAILAAKKSKAILFGVHPFLLKLALGEQCEMLLGSHNSSASKITGDGFKFKFEEIQKALVDIYK